MHKSVHTENLEIRNGNLHAGTFNKTIPYPTTGRARMFFSGSGLNVSCFGKSGGLYRVTSFSSVSPFLLCSDFFPPQVKSPLQDSARTSYRTWEVGPSLAAAPQGWRAPRRGPEAGTQEVPPPLP